METCGINERVEQTLSPFKTIQIHPTKLCNLACIHCYSDSMPGLKQMLDIDVLLKFLSYAYEEGYNNIAVSGGEPFLYKYFLELVKEAKNIGYQTTVASNGMLLGSDRNQQILKYIDLIAISIDGKEDLHDAIRGQKGAYKKMLEGVEILNSYQSAFGFIHTITNESWQDLLWLGEFAVEQGAKLLQLHPLEMFGRAINNMEQFELDELMRHRSFILANYLQDKYREKLVVQLDILHREHIESFPTLVNPFFRTCSHSGRMADILDTIVVDEKGDITPVSYGFSSNFSIGNIHDFTDKLFEDFVVQKVEPIERIYTSTLKKVLKNKQNDMVNWGELLIEESRLAG
ncbi:MAG: radical SAM protein [Leadbetterella sp.]